MAQYTDNYTDGNGRDGFAREGRQIAFSDGQEAYHYPFPEPDTVDEAWDSFAEGYDMGAAERVRIEITVYQDGESVLIEDREIVQEAA